MKSRQHNKTSEDEPSMTPPNLTRKPLLTLLSRVVFWQRTQLGSKPGSASHSDTVLAGRNLKVP